MNISTGITNFAKRIKNSLAGGSKVSMGPNLDRWKIEDFERTPTKDLENLYLASPLAFQGINLFSNAIMGRGFFIPIADDNKKAEALCRFTLDLPSFKPTLLEAVTQTLVGGQSYQEQIWKGSVIARFKSTDPKTFEPKWDDYGTIERYEQTIKTQVAEPILFDPEQIVFYRFFRIGDSIKGIGFIEPLKETLESEADIGLSIKEAVSRFAHPPLWIKKHGASDSEVRKMEEDFKDYDRSTFFATSDRYDIDFISLYNRFPDLADQMDYILNKICAGLRIPKAVLLGVGDTVNRSTLESLIDHNQDEIRHIQDKISRIIEEQIFKPLCEKNSLRPIPRLKWYPLVTEDERQKAEIRHIDIDSILRIFGAELIEKEEAIKRINLLFED